MYVMELSCGCAPASFVERDVEDMEWCKLAMRHVNPCHLPGDFQNQTIHSIIQKPPHMKLKLLEQEIL